MTSETGRKSDENRITITLRGDKYVSRFREIQEHLGKDGKKALNIEVVATLLESFKLDPTVVVPVKVSGDKLEDRAKTIEDDFKKILLEKTEETPKTRKVCVPDYTCRGVVRNFENGELVPCNKTTTALAGSNRARLELCSDCYEIVEKKGFKI